MKKLIKFIKETRNEILFKRLFSFLNRHLKKRKKNIILDMGSGKECFVAKRLMKKNGISKKYHYINCDYFKKKEITQYKKKGIKCISIKNKSKCRPNIIILNDTLHHIFHKEIDYPKIGKYLSKLLNQTKCIFIKDHFVNNSIDVLILKIMDWIGNIDNSNSKLPNNYFIKKRFLQTLKKNKIIIKNLDTKTKYYSGIFLFFSRSSLHFTVELYKSNKRLVK